MSSALLEMEEVVARPRVRLEPVPHAAAKVVDEDRHPLLPVFIAGAIALMVATTMVGSILAWLALRHSGIMAP